jgi:hypothetical protein
VLKLESISAFSRVRHTPGVEILSPKLKVNEVGTRLRKCSIFLNHRERILRPLKVSVNVGERFEDARFIRPQTVGAIQILQRVVVVTKSEEQNAARRVAGVEEVAPLLQGLIVKANCPFRIVVAQRNPPPFHICKPVGSWPNSDRDV